MSAKDFRSQCYLFFRKQYYPFAYSRIYESKVRTKKERENQADFLLHDSFLEFEMGVDYGEINTIQKFEQYCEQKKGLILTIIHRKAIRVNINNQKKQLNHLPEEKDFESPKKVDSLLKIDIQFMMTKIKEKFGEDHVLILSKISQGAQYDEIADELQIPMGTVKGRLSRMREFLNKKFKNEQ